MRGLSASGIAFTIAEGEILDIGALGAVLDAVRDQDPARTERAMRDLLAESTEDTDHLTNASEATGTRSTC
ncbi:hypothetical protein [Streptomyces pactum]|uniref:Uncharacterized protein n=1 Tax=Streptomyces pactum TaxID=68249 RepID=A0A1S6J3P4_9ACTN|nr:hypothetical protein [Streptomyces pactum]AQS66358.1 hypothetical protein B1H29_04940 [Streptomyces pactum]